MDRRGFVGVVAHHYLDPAHRVGHRHIVGADLAVGQSRISVGGVSQGHSVGHRGDRQSLIGRRPVYHSQRRRRFGGQRVPIIDPYAPALVLF